MQTTTITAPTRTRTRLTLRAPALQPVVALWQRVLDAPDDKRARIQLGLMTNAGQCDCPACGTPLSVEGWRQTHTAFSSREEVLCYSCDAVMLLSEACCA